MYAAFFKESGHDRTTILGSPVLMTKEEAAVQPATLIVVAGVDPLQAEGKHFGHILQLAGVDTTVFQADGQVHDFVMLEPTRKSPTARAAVELAALKLKNALTIGR
jgi:acetyl esterase